MKLDAIGAIEACYAPAVDEEAWLRGVLRALAPVDRGLGLYATRFDAGDPARVRFDPRVVAWNEDPAWHQAASAATFGGPRELVDALYRGGPPVGLASHRMRRLPDHLRPPLLPGGMDVLGVFARDVDGQGLLVGIPVRDRSAVPGPRLRHALAAIAAHLTAARRLRGLARGPVRDAAADAEAVLDPRGRVAHARDEAAERDAREALGSGVRAVERARGAARRTAPGEAVELWRALVAGRWSLVDSVDADGKRYVLARRNTPGVREPKALTPAERDVLGYAALGHANKYVAYLLGLGPSTVAAHLASARRKLGVRSRAELIRAFHAGS